MYSRVLYILAGSAIPERTLSASVGWAEASWGEWLEDQPATQIIGRFDVASANGNEADESPGWQEDMRIVSMALLESLIDQV